MQKIDPWSETPQNRQDRQMGCRTLHRNSRLLRQINKEDKTKQVSRYKEDVTGSLYIMCVHSLTGPETLWELSLLILKDTIGKLFT